MPGARLAREPMHRFHVEIKFGVALTTQREAYVRQKGAMYNILPSKSCMCVCLLL